MDPSLKSALRAQALAARAAVQNRDVAEAAMNAHLAALLARHPEVVVAGYVPMRGEADPRPALSGHSGPVCLPVVMAPAAPLAFRLWRGGDALEGGALGTTHPPESAPVVTPDIVVVPLAGFDGSGGRLGYGGGFYDRTLAQLRRAAPVLAVGFAFEAQRLPLIPVEDTDEPLDLIVTQSGCHSIARA
ncbi:5-formyltetrahydrofolate cyclo-ligase [Paracoccus suum]|uniref:5-formyltetrahydrofolate cyclo-ligase n=1 Tax=Paracoccus suum TaxID=2259340 RepID=A0A344PL39_9RHOB|nr:5-formyltetrahydrofolate cyclo-ligase [Paracoccus suum]AXC50094.1 5-formyltetrahydrofolate cyclo-ligase [Paracoccus suum]